MKNAKLSLIAAALITAGSQANAAEMLITGNDSKVVLKMAQEWGKAELKKSSEGNPMIRGEIDGLNYTITFGSCKNGKDCADMTFWAYWEGGSLEQANAWNAGKTFGRAYIDEDGDTNVDYIVNLVGGITPENLADTFEWWNHLLQKFHESFEE